MKQKKVQNIGKNLVKVWFIFDTFNLAMIIHAIQVQYTWNTFITIIITLIYP
jgi:hypothetical protein